MLRFSIRELALLISFLGLGCAALKYAGQAWYVVLLGCSFLIFMIVGVLAIVERGERQATALGFVFWMGICALLCLTHSDMRTFPTEKLLNPVFETTVTRTWTDVRTGQLIADYDRSKTPRRAEEHTIPEHRWFMAIGHVLWALLLGYVGCRLAGWLYSRRVAKDGASRAT